MQTPVRGRAEGGAGCRARGSTQDVLLSFALVDVILLYACHHLFLLQQERKRIHARSFMLLIVPSLACTVHIEHHTCMAPVGNSAHHHPAAGAGSNSCGSTTDLTI